VVWVSIKCDNKVGIIWIFNIFVGIIEDLRGNINVTNGFIFSLNINTYINDPIQQWCGVAI
jgi:hypothetical protein